MKRWLIGLAVVLAFAGATVAASFLWANYRLKAAGPAMTATSVVIPRGTGTPGIAQLLQESGAIETQWLFLLESRLNGKQGLQAGEYALPAHASMGTIIDMMNRGQVVVHKFTMAEGMTVFQLLAELRHTEGLVGNISLPPEEGSLLPQTYFYSFGDSRDGLVMRMSRSMNEVLDDLWPKRSPGLAVQNKVEALILASIVERETALPEERPHIAAVFLNRLKLHMRLQSDPTVIYAVSNGEGALDHSLTRDELGVKSAFNTYVTDGLPVGPICNPGRASIAAVLKPAPSDDLYFVADGKGGHVFARTLVEHNKNVAHWRALDKAGH